MRDFAPAWPREFASDLGSPAVSSVSPLLLSLVSHWSLEAASGTRVDDYGANHLTDNNTVTQNTGIIGNAAEFTAANSEKLNIASNATLETGDIDFSLGCWFFPVTAANSGIVTKASADGSTTFEYGLYFLSTRIVRFVVGSNAAVQSLDASVFGALTLNTWNFAIAWQVGGGSPTLNISINDTTPQSVARTVTPVANATKPFNVGSCGTNAFLGGRVDEALFAKRILIAAERTWLYNAGAGRSWAEIVAYRG